MVPTKVLKACGRAVLAALLYTAAFPAGPACAQSPPALTLEGAIAAALATHPAARAAAQQFAQAQARLAQAQAQRRFSITFNSTASGSNASVLQPPPAQETFGTLQNTLTVPLPLGRRPGFAVRQADEQLLAAQSAYQSARLVLAGQVTTAFYDLLRKQALRTAAQETRNQAARELSDAQKRNRAGDAAQLDVLQAQVPLANAEANLGRAETDVMIAQEVLNDVIGQPLDAPVSIADVVGLPPTLPYTLAQVRAFALGRSADVRAADAILRASTAALEAARLYREPIFSLQAIDIRSSDQTSFSREDTLQAAVTVPLSDGGLGQAQIREAEAAQAQAQAQAQSARKTALVGISAAYLTAGSARAQTVAALATRAIAQLTYDKTVRGYQNGLFPLVVVLNAQNALAQARIAYIQALYDAASAASALESAVGGVATPPFAAPILPTPNSNPPGAAGTSPAGAGNPGASPAGNSTTGPGAGGANAGGRGGP